MPPSHHSSSSHSSRSHSSSHRHSSSSHSSRSHSSSHSHSSSSHSSSYGSSSHSSSYGSRSSTNPYRDPNRNYIPSGAPSHIRDNSIHIRCRSHRYIYYPENWKDSQTGKTYERGYYNEIGKHYYANEIAFKYPDGNYKASFVCEYCGAGAEYMWREGQFPTCQQCGAAMTKVPTYIDEIVDVSKATVLPSYSSSNRSRVSTETITMLILAGLFGVIVWIGIIMSAIHTIANASRYNRVTSSSSSDYYRAESTDYDDETDEDSISNTDIYGTTIYLDEVETNVYVLCESDDEYEKKLTWDYGVECYYDSTTDCYIWFNTDVSPNLWQYWYEDIGGDNEYGWMEYESTGWYIEVDDGEWESYDGDTSQLWHIQSDLDE